MMNSCLTIVFFPFFFVFPALCLCALTNLSTLSTEHCLLGEERGVDGCIGEYTLLNAKNKSLTVILCRPMFFSQALQVQDSHCLSFSLKTLMNVKIMVIIFRHVEISVPALIQKDPSTVSVWTVT